MKMLFKIATPVSHLFENEELKTKLIMSSDILELRDNDIPIKNQNSFIYHSELNFLAKWSYREIKKLEEMKGNYHIEFVSYHLSSKYQKNIISNNAFVGVGEPFSISEMKSNIRDNIKITMDIFGYDLPILVENNNHLLTDAYDIVTDPEFIKEIIEENDLYLLLDLAHAKITSINKNIDFEQYLMKLPLNRCKQIHLSGYSIINGFAIDSHSEIQKEVWPDLKDLLKLLYSIEYITIEYYQDGHNLLNQLEILKSIQGDFKLNNLLQILEWDTKFFGFKVAKLESLILDSKLLRKVIEKAHKENIKCIYCLSNSKNEDLLKTLGFNKIDEKIEFSNIIRHNNDENELDIKEAREEDISAIKRIASNAFRGKTRFYKDNHFNLKKVDELYELWIDKLINDENSTIIIIKKNDKIIGFNGISLKNGEGRIDLIAVDKKYKNKGYGSLLVKQAYKFFDQLNLKKKNEMKVTGKRIYLRTLTENDVTQRYYSWINDPEVTKYIDSKKKKIEELKHYVKVKYEDPNCLFLGIFSKKNNLHIGNVKLEPIDFNRRTARLGLLIGDKNYWNKGYESETFLLVEDFVFKDFKLIEVQSDTYKEDFKQFNELKKSGFNLYEEDNNLYKFKMNVSTQVKNIAAKSLYSKMGFTTQEKECWYHWWNED